MPGNKTNAKPDSLLAQEEGINSLNYKSSGVDIDAGNELVENIKPLAKATTRSGVASGLGGFGAMFDLKAAGYNDPILVAATDGVGTKLKIAIESGEHETVGIDLVAMCVNDLVVQGAEPLFFLDYYATSSLDVGTAKNIIKGIAAGCRLAGCALIGGETAEMPGMYVGKDYDLAGFAVGAVERGHVLDGANVSEGDVVLGLPSSGLHANGFSLVRKVIEKNALDIAAAATFDNTKKLSEVLLEPTRIYVKSCLAAINAGGVKALAHITGGGLIENIPRVLPSGVAAEIDTNAWTLPPIFSWLSRAGNIVATEMARTFNCGIGMVMVVEANKANEIKATLIKAGEYPIIIGKIVSRLDDQPAVIIKGLDASWRS